MKHHCIKVLKKKGCNFLGKVEAKGKSNVLKITLLCDNEIFKIINSDG